MGRHTGNEAVVSKLEDALQDFLSDHRKSAQNDPEWVKATANASPEELENESGCGCDDCIVAGQLLGRIY